MVLSRRGNATRISNAARVACDINTRERVVLDGRPCPHPLPRWAGTPSCRSIGERGPEEGWVVEKNPNQDECGSHVSVFLLCHVDDQRAQPYLGCSPTHCCDQIQSAVPKNNIKSKHEGFETSGVGGVGWGGGCPFPFPQSSAKASKWSATGKPHSFAEIPQLYDQDASSSLMLFAQFSSVSHALASACLFLFVSPWVVRCLTPLKKPICRRQLSEAGREGIPCSGKEPAQMQ